MVGYLLVPFVDRALLRAVLVRIDQIKGYPRTHTLTDPACSFGRDFRGWATPPRTETCFAVWIHADSGPIALRRVIAVLVDDLATQLGGRFVEHLGVRKRLREWVTDRGWQLRADLPDVPADPYAPSPWTPVAARDGAAGSVTGVPILEGQE